MQPTNCRGFVVHFANGRPKNPAVGSVGTAIIRNISMMDAARNGTRSKHAAFVRPAYINGNGLHACNAADGQNMKTGTVQVMARNNP